MDIIDNFLDKTIFKQIQKIIMSDAFPWYYKKHISTTADAKHLYFFSHNFLKNEVRSGFFGLWENFLKKLNYKALIRSKDSGSPKSLLKNGMVPGILYGKGAKSTKITFEDKILTFILGFER